MFLKIFFLYHTSKTCLGCIFQETLSLGLSTLVHFTFVTIDMFSLANIQSNQKCNCCLIRDRKIRIIFSPVPNPQIFGVDMKGSPQMEKCTSMERGRWYVFSNNSLKIIPNTITYRAYFASNHLVNVAHANRTFCSSP